MILAAILLLVLLGILTALFVPLRYRADIRRYPKELHGRGTMSWLLHLITLTAEYNNGEYCVMLRICGIRRQLFPEQERKKRSRSRKKNPVCLPGEPPAEDVVEEVPSIEEKSIEEPEESAGIELIEERNASVKAERGSKEERSEKSKSIRARIRGWIQKLKELFAFLQSLPERLAKIPERLRLMMKNWNAAKAKFLEHLELYRTHQDLIKRMKGHGFYLLRHIRPRNIKGKISFGFDDPAITGQAMGLIALLLPGSCSKICLQPDFRNVVLEGELSLKGHIRSFHAMRIGWKLFRDKELRNLIKRFRS